TDYIDILMFHWPVTGKYVETWKRMIKLYNQGYVKILGVANCNQHHLDDLYSETGVYPSINQFERHPLFTQKKLVDYCKDKSIVVEAYTPIARFDDRLVRLPVLKRIAEKYHKNFVQIILRWHVQTGVIPIVRAMSSAHQKQNLDIFNFSLTDEEIDVISKININSRMRYDPDNCDFTIL
ncbi:MAG: aldo/keto reductase, partial [Succinivibrio sp.]|nr:aldo/keto reductase [Succinivibrio sp.]